jgi:hypothetical protein
MGSAKRSSPAIAAVVAPGTIGGTGLKLYPDSMINLYHRVLGEDTHAKASSGTGVGLPWKSCRYFTAPDVP